MKDVDEILNDGEFKTLMKAHVMELLEYLFINAESFSLIATREFVEFKPPLPDDIVEHFDHPVIMFELAGYTLQSAHIEKGKLKFHAAFGEDDFESFLSIPLGAVVQIFVDKTPVLVNFAVYESVDDKKEKSKRVFSKFKS